jgi:protein SCO1/2
MNRLARVLAFVCCSLVAGGACAYVTPADLSRRVGFDQRLGEPIPPELSFRDETGRTVKLADYYGAAPIVLVFAWYGCTTLCPTVVANLVDALDRSGLAPDAYQVVVASIDPRDSAADAARMKRIVLADARSATRPNAWHLLTGTEAAIAALTGAAGFRYAYDGQSHQYAHPAGIVLLTPRGTVAHYLFGFDFTPAQLHEVVAAAALSRIVSPVDRLLLLCFHFAPSGKYSEEVLDGLRVGSVAMLLGGAVLFVVLHRRTRGTRSRMS